MPGVNTLKTVGRVTALVLLLVSSLGPWFTDSHPATKETCTAPLVWLGSGHCACLVSLMATFREAVIAGQSSLIWLCMPLVLPFLSTLLLFLGGETRLGWLVQQMAWGLAAAFSLFLFIGSWYSNKALIQWGAGLCGVVAIALLVGEILAVKHRVE